MTLLPPLLHAPGQHHDGSAVGLPAHPPEVVPGGVQRTLGHDELSLGVEAGDEVSIDVVAAILIISRLQLHSAVIVGQDVGEPRMSRVSEEELIINIFHLFLGLLTGRSAAEQGWSLPTCFSSSNSSLNRKSLSADMIL